MTKQKAQEELETCTKELNRKHSQMLNTADTFMGEIVNHGLSLTNPIKIVCVIVLLGFIFLFLHSLWFDILGAILIVISVLVLVELSTEKSALQHEIHEIAKNARSEVQRNGPDKT